jgi:ligand-binding SRPBCC domain-containing protein
MRKGAFASMSHRHEFAGTDGGGTLMRDSFTFRAPLGPLGRIAEWLILTAYMREFLMRRNAHLKQSAEAKPLRSTDEA